LAKLTTLAVQKWVAGRLAAASQAGPLAHKHAVVSLNSQLRACCRLFGRKLAKSTELLLPVPLPFSEVEKPKVPRPKFYSPVKAADLLAAARVGLGGEGAVLVDLRKREAWFVFMLALGAGLRKGEIDALCWAQVDEGAGEIRICTTVEAGVKTEHSEGVVPIGDDLKRMLAEKRKTARGRFVIEGADDMPRPERGKKYRCAEVFEDLGDWLRANGLPAATVATPLHTLRKLFGSEIAKRAGIFAASSMLRHADITQTRDFYADDRMVKTALDTGAWFNEGAVK
jgi:integrase